MAFEPHELKLAVVSAIRIVPNGLQLIPRVPACTTAAFILQPLSKNWNFLVLVFSRIRSKPMWTPGKVDYAWVRPYWYPAFYSPSWTYHLAKETHQHTYLLFLGCGWTDRWSRSGSWCWLFENELSLSVPVSNMVSKCWITPKATNPQKKPNAGPASRNCTEKTASRRYPRNCFALDWWRTLAPHWDLGHEKHFLS